MSQSPTPFRPAHHVSDRERITEKIAGLRAQSVQFVAVSTAGALVTTGIGFLFFASGKVLIWQAGVVLILASITAFTASIPRNLTLIPWLLRRDPMSMSADEIRTWTILREDMPLTIDQAARRAGCSRDDARRVARLLQLVDEVAVRGDVLERDR